jgi:adenylate cyclase
MDYTVIGDGVNLAARLGTANKQVGTELLISGMTVNLLHDNYHVRELDLIRVKGKTNPIPISEVFGYAHAPLPELKNRLLSGFSKGLQAYRQRDWLSATRNFNSAVKIDVPDKPSQIFLQRAEHYASAPPADDWDGVWTLYDK